MISLTTVPKLQIPFTTILNIGSLKSWPSIIPLMPMQHFLKITFTTILTTQLMKSWTSMNPLQLQSSKPHTVIAKEKDYQALCPLFGWLSTDTIKCTFESTTQYARIPMSTILKKHFQSPNPALNVPCQNEPVATDTVYSDTPAIDSGVTTAQFFVGCDSMVVMSMASSLIGNLLTPWRITFENVVPLSS